MIGLAPLAVKTAPEMTYTVSGGALNSAQSINRLCGHVTAPYKLYLLGQVMEELATLRVLLVSESGIEKMSLQSL